MTWTCPLPVMYCYLDLTDDTDLPVLYYYVDELFVDYCNHLNSSCSSPAGQEVESDLTRGKLCVSLALYSTLPTHYIIHGYYPYYIHTFINRIVYIIIISKIHGQKARRCPLNTLSFSSISPCSVFLYSKN